MKKFISKKVEATKEQSCHSIDNRLIVSEDHECICSRMPMMMTTPMSCTVNIILADRLLGFARKEPSTVPGIEKCQTSNSGAPLVL